MNGNIDLSLTKRRVRVILIGYGDKEKMTGAILREASQDAMGVRK